LSERIRTTVEVFLSEGLTATDLGLMKAHLSPGANWSGANVALPYPQLLSNKNYVVREQVKSNVSARRFTKVSEPSRRGKRLRRQSRLL